MSILTYLIKVSLALLLFWVLYRAAFRQLTFFQWNRFYLMASVVFAIVLPILKLGWGGPLASAVDIRVIDRVYMDHISGSPAAPGKVPETWTSLSVLMILYMVVACFMILRSALRYRNLHAIVKGSRRIRGGRVKVYVQDQTRGSFTLFRCICLDSHAYENRLRPVLRHEMVHAIQLHSLDLFVMELLTVLLWFNPVVFVLRRDVMENHEYLADHYASCKTRSLAGYLECLKAETLRYFKPLPVSYFNRSTIKKRIIMLTNQKSSSDKKWRYLGTVLVVALMILLFHSPSDQSLAGSSLRTEHVLNAADLQFPLPEQYKVKITWGFKQEGKNPVTKENTIHKGIDVAAPTGTPVFAAGAGVVRRAENEKGWGKLIVVEHEDGYTTYYAHLDEILVEEGTTLSKGEVIGRVGNTGQSSGPHLHYEVRKDGEHVNPEYFY